LEYDLLTLFPFDCDKHKLLGTTFSDCVVCCNSRVLHLDSSNVINTTVFGVSSREAEMNSHSRCISGWSVAKIKSFNINSCTEIFNDNACKAFMWLDTWLINWRNDDASSNFLGAFDLNALHASWQLIFVIVTLSLYLPREKKIFVCNL